MYPVCLNNYKLNIGKIFQLDRLHITLLLPNQQNVIRRYIYTCIIYINVWYYCATPLHSAEFRRLVPASCCVQLALQRSHTEMFPVDWHGCHWCPHVSLWIIPRGTGDIRTLYVHRTVLAFLVLNFTNFANLKAFA